jgi:hypothetical protein
MKRRPQQRKRQTWLALPASGIAETDHGQIAVEPSTADHSTTTAKQSPEKRLLQRDFIQANEALIKNPCIWGQHNLR